MPKYICKNKECADYSIEKTCNSITKWIGDELVDSATECPICKQNREQIKGKIYPVVIHGIKPI